MVQNRDLSRAIKIIDLPSLHAPIESELKLAINSVVREGNYIGGQYVKDFESSLGEYLNAHVLGVGNGTDALQIALLSLGIGVGDDVLVPSFSYFASVEAISAVGANPVFVDVCDNTYVIDFKDLEAKITSKTKAVIVVHLYGLSCPMAELLRIRSAFGLKIVEDCAQAIGTECVVHGVSMKVGTIGDVGTYSFFPSKNLGALGDGGAIVAKDKKLLEIAKSISQHGQTEKYKHVRIGMNSRLDAIQAAVLHVKLKYLEGWNIERRRVASIYNEMLSGEAQLSLPTVPPESKHVYHQYTIVFNGDREVIMNHLWDLGIPVRLYYPMAIHQQPVYNHLNVSLPITEYLQKQMFSLPIHPNLSNEDAEYVANSLLNILRK